MWPKVLGRQIFTPRPLLNTVRQCVCCIRSPGSGHILDGAFRLHSLAAADVAHSSFGGRVQNAAILLARFFCKQTRGNLPCGRPIEVMSRCTCDGCLSLFNNIKRELLAPVKNARHTWLHNVLCGLYRPLQRYPPSRHTARK